MSSPWRVVQWLSAAPNARTTSACGSSSAATGEANPPEMRSAHGSPWKMPCAIALLASSAPIRSPSAASAGPGAGEDGAAAGDDHRSLRALQQVGDGGDLLRARRGRAGTGAGAARAPARRAAPAGRSAG